MQTETAVVFIQGATAMGFLALSVFFLRFWLRMRDRLFACFSLAFLIFAVNNVLIVIFGSRSESAVAIYGARAVAFGLILFAFFDKNRAPPA
jgi:hypothetical protein